MRTDTKKLKWISPNSKYCVTGLLHKGQLNAEILIETLTTRKKRQWYKPYSDNKLPKYVLQECQLIKELLEGA